MSHFTDISSIEPGDEALDMITQSLARESAVLPISVTGDSIHVIVPDDHLDSSIVDKLQFVLNRNVTFDTAPRELLVLKVDEYYPRPGGERWSPVAPDGDIPASIPEFEHDLEFPFLDFVGRVDHQTPGSVSFSLGRWSNKLDFDGTTTTYDRNCVFNGLGWLDAHFPSTGSHKLFIRCRLPPEYIKFETMRDLLPFITSALALPATVSYKMHLASSESAMGMEHPQDGFVCTTKWRMPGELD